MKNQFIKRLDQIAYKKSVPFCYSCYSKAISSRCKACGSDDLMRLTDSGCEFGTTWIHEEILSKFESVDTEERFCDMVSSCYESEIKLGWITVDATAIKELDPISWDLAKSEYLDAEESDGALVSFDNGGSYYDADYLDEKLSEMEEELIISSEEV